MSEKDRGDDTIDRGVSTAFWEKQARNAADPRSTTLTRDSVASVHRHIRRAQRWMFTRLDAAGCRYEHVADLACGNGDWTVPLATRARRLFAADLTPGFLDTANERVRALDIPVDAMFVQSDLARVELPGEHDLVVVGAVLQLLGDDDVLSALERIRAAVRADAHVYVRTTVAQHVDRLVTKTDEYQAIYRHRSFYNQVFLDAGFDIVHEADTTDYMADEIARDLLGSLGRPFVWPIRLVRRAYRRPRRYGVHVWILRPRA
jgi:SAM-dependent methyltransferase